MQIFIFIILIFDRNEIFPICIISDLKLILFSLEWESEFEIYQK